MASLDEQIRCVKREIAMRKNVYAKRISDNRMKKAEADYETEMMQAVLETLETLKANANAA